MADLLTLKSGKKVVTREQWARRRSEIVEDFEREVYGRIPKGVPKIEWKVVGTDTGTLNGVRVNARQLVGHVDNSAFPAITVDIAMTLVLPADVKTPVPVMIQTCCPSVTGEGDDMFCF